MRIVRLPQFIFVATGTSVLTDAVELGMASVTRELDLIVAMRRLAGQEDSFRLARFRGNSVCEVTCKAKAEHQPQYPKATV